MEWITSLTVVLVVLTGALIFYSVCSFRSSEKLRRAIEKLQKTGEEVLEIQLTSIGASLSMSVAIPKSFLGEDLEILKGNMRVLEGLERVTWSWEEDALKISYGLNRLLEVYFVLQANARKPELILERLTPDLISILIIRSCARQQERRNELLQELGTIPKSRGSKN